MVVIINAVMFPDRTSVHVKGDFDSVMTLRPVWVSLLDKLVYYGDILKSYFILDNNNNDDNDKDEDKDNGKRTFHDVKCKKVLLNNCNSSGSL